MKISDSYLGMDQQLELKLDVKEASAVPTEHPQWDISESESEKEDPHGNESEYTTDSDEDDDWIRYCIQAREKSWLYS